MPKSDTPALVAAARMLAMRPLSRKMLVDKLLEKEYDEDEVALAADAMEELGALDDADYASVFADDRAARGWGAIRIRQELLRRGLDRELVDEVVDQLDDPADVIAAFILHKTRGEPIDRRTSDKIVAALIRKGFSWSQIRPAIQEHVEYME